MLPEWEPFYVHGPQRVSWVGSVLRSCTTIHNGILLIGPTVGDLYTVICPRCVSYVSKDEHIVILLRCTMYGILYLHVRS